MYVVVVRLTLPGRIVEDGREKATFDIDKGGLLIQNTIYYISCTYCTVADKHHDLSNFSFFSLH